MVKTIQFPISKSKQVQRFAKIQSSACYFPPCVVNNEELIAANSLPVTDKVVQKKLGVAQRHVADFSMVDSDLLTNAAKTCLERTGIEPDRVTRILVTKFLGDNLLPMTAAIVQRKLGCKIANHCYDIDGGTNSFLQAFDIASTYIATGDQYVLIVSGGILQRFVDNSDPRMSLLFGDGAASILLSVDESQHILGTYFLTDYTHVDLFTGFDTSWPLPEDAFSGRNTQHFYNLYKQGNWRDATDSYIKAARIILQNVCQQASVSKDEIKYVIINELNREFIKEILAGLEFPLEKNISYLSNYGNLMSASIPMLLDSLLKNSPVHKGDLVFVLSLGEGISGGGMIYKV